MFGDKHLDEIKRADIQNYLSDLTSKEKYRTAEKLKVQLKAIFDVAVSDYNFKSPMAKVELATLILCKNGQNRYPTLPKCFFLHKKKREIVLISLKFVRVLTETPLFRGCFDRQLTKTPLFQTYQKNPTPAEVRF